VTRQEYTVSIGVGDPDRLDAFVDAGATHIILGIGEPWNFAAVGRLVTYRDSRQRVEFHSAAT